MATKVEKNKKKRDRSRRQHDEYIRKLAVQNEFNAALKRVLIALNIDPALFRQLPDDLKKKFLQRRTRSVRLVVSDGIKPSRRVLDHMRFTISGWLAEVKAPVLPGYGEVTLEDYYTAGLTLFFHFYNEKNLRKEEIRIRQILFPLIDPFIHDNNPPLKIFDLLLQALGSMHSRINQSFFYLNHLPYSWGSGPTYRISSSAILYQQKAEIRNVFSDGNARPAYRVGWPIVKRGVNWLKLSARNLGIDSSFADLRMDVYAQSHVFIRLRERLNTLYPHESHLMLFTSFLVMEQTPAVYKNSILIPAIHSDVRMGYFPIEIVDGMILVKTFLFITNSGTPEGDRLDKELHTGKLEKEFLNIDKLSTFVNTDLPKDPKIREIFEKVGLGALCTLNPKKFTRIDKVWTGYAADFMKYMCVADRDYC
ncbi:MAG TPA: hypothetical protein VHO70_02345 [Chitinispirillaceae bacterium]|nr:hypothetical protein [Chitinispirillaceae bacterium]